MTKKPSVYIETTIVSYLVSKPSRDPVTNHRQGMTVEWWKRNLALVHPIASPAVMQEASRGDAAEVRKRVAVLKPLGLLKGGPEVEALARIYLSRHLIPESSAFDALHLAYASVHAVDFLMTWNCRHLASAQVRKRVALINAELGRATPTLCTPEELMELPG